jgi:hypothetical protein
MAKTKKILDCSVAEKAANLVETGGEFVVNSAQEIYDLLQNIEVEDALAYADQLEIDCKTLHDQSVRLCQRIRELKASM